MSDVKLVRTDRNGTKYYESYKCEKCGGSGYIREYDYVEGGRCFLCDGSGSHYHSWKEYTPEYAEKLEQRRIARLKKQAPEKNAKTFKLWKLSEEGTAYVVLGNTYERKDELKELGAHYHSLLGWYFDHPVEGIDTYELTIDELADFQNMCGEWVIYLPYYSEGSYNLLPVIREAQDAYKAKGNPSQYLGNIGDKLTVDVTVKNVAGFDTDWGYIHIFTFVDNQGNEIVWKTDTKYFEKGETLTLTGKVKEHSEFRCIKQTVLTRCKVTNWSGEE